MAPNRVEIRTYGPLGSLDGLFPAVWRDSLMR